MKKTFFSEKQIAALKEPEAGVPVKELSRRIGVSDVNVRRTGRSRSSFRASFRRKVEKY